MNLKHIIIYCDESAENGKFYSNFYGGVLVAAEDQEPITKRLNGIKAQLNFHGEIKWTKITENYQEKYICFINAFFDEIESGKLKVRIMFRQNTREPSGLEDYQIDNQYFLLYYQFIKHAFGLQYSDEESLDVSVFLDDVPHTIEKFSQFRDYIVSIGAFPVFRSKNIRFLKENITDVRSHEHVILQGLDIILGAMNFRLNNLHTAKPEGQSRRGKRTKAKEKVYKAIYERIRKIYPNFNIGISTGNLNCGIEARWKLPYRHWSFVPSDSSFNSLQTKRRKK